MTDRYVFAPHTSLTTFEQAASGTVQGQYELNRMASEFASVVDLLQHTQSFAAGASTIVHMPDGNNIAIVNIPRREFAVGITDIATAAGFPLT